MDKKLGRLLRPRMGMYFLVLALFTLGAVLSRAYILAAVEAVITLALVIVYLIRQRKRHRELQTYLNSAMDAVSSARETESPFPVLMLRLEDRVVIYVNSAFASAVSFNPGLSDKPLEDVLPGFSVDWLTAGKRESPRDVTLGVGAAGSTAPPSGPATRSRPFWACCISRT